MGLMLAAVALAALAYGYYLYHLTHSRPLAADRASAAAVPVAAKPAATAAKAVTTTAAVAITTPTAQTLEVKTTTTPTTTHPAETGIAGAWTHMLETLKITKAAPGATASHTESIEITLPATQPAAVAVATTSASVAPVPSKPVVPHWRQLTSEQRLARAGEVAMENMLVLASKYPDSYGFRAEDAFQKATLGKAVPIYTISETDRAKYQPGQRVKPLLKSTGQWMFPVLSGNHICCMVKVTYDGHEYIPGESSKSLGQAWSVISAKWPEEAGFHPQLVVYPAMPGYYFTVPELSVPNVTDTVKMTVYQPDVSPADVILASWR